MDAIPGYLPTITFYPAPEVVVPQHATTAQHDFPLGHLVPGWIKSPFARKALAYGAAAGVAATALYNRKELYRAYRRIMIRLETTRMMSAMEGIAGAEAEEEENEEPEADDVVLPGVPIGDAEEALAAIEDAARAARTEATRIRRRRRAPLQLCFGGKVLTGQAAEVAQRAKLVFGTNPLTDYNRTAVRRWLNKELVAACEGIRTKDLLKWLPLMELFVFYKLDEDMELEAVYEELQVMGRIRGGAP